MKLVRRTKRPVKIYRKFSVALALNKPFDEEQVRHAKFFSP